MSALTLAERDAAALAGIARQRFFPLAVASGQGSWLTEPGGRSLLDLSATWTAAGLGNGHPAVARAVARAAADGAGASGFSAVNADAVALAEELLECVPGSGERRVYLGHSGTDACEVAIGAARHATGRRPVLAFANSYHGGFGAAMEASGMHAAPGATAGRDTVFVPFPDPYRGPAGDPAAELRASLGAVARAFGRQSFACVIVEPVQSDGGLVVPPDGFLAGLLRLCRAHGALLICDEVKVGLGRTGLLHAFEHDGVVPDLITLGKVLGGGLPLSAVVGPASVLDHPAASALMTTAGNPVCAAAGRAVLATIRREQLARCAAERGEQLRWLLLDYAASRRPGAEFVGEVRGRGLCIGVDLVTDRPSRRRAGELARQVVYRAWQLGAVVYYVAANVLEVTPPLTITAEETVLAADFITRAIDDAVNGLVPPEVVAPYTGWPDRGLPSRASLL